VLIIILAYTVTVSVCGTIGVKCQRGVLRIVSTNALVGTKSLFHTVGVRECSFRVTTGKMRNKELLVMNWNSLLLFFIECSRKRLPSVISRNNINNNYINAAYLFEVTAVANLYLTFTCFPQ